MAEHEVAASEDVDSQALVEEIARFLMLRDGKLVDDLGNLDASIRRWVEQLADATFLEAEQVRIQGDLHELVGVASLEEDQAALSFVARLIGPGTDPATTQDAQEIVRSGYLDQAPELPS